MSANNYEFYNLKEADIHQTVYGLPKGYYRLAFDGLYRAGDAIPAALSRREGKEPQNALVYAESGEGMGEYKYTTGDQVLPDSLFPESKALYHIIVNNVSGADLAFQEGLYAGDFSFYVSETGQPGTIGVRKDSLVANDWAVFDNFTLLYYGDGDANKPDDFESAIDGVTAEGKAKIVSSAWYTLDGVRVKEPRQRGIYISHACHNKSLLNKPLAALGIHLFNSANGFKTSKKMNKDWLKTFKSCCVVLFLAAQINVFTGCERAGKLDFLGTRGARTLFPPINSGVEAFLKEKGYASVEDIPVSYCDTLLKACLVERIIYTYDLGKTQQENNQLDLPLIIQTDGDTLDANHMVLSIINQHHQPACGHHQRT